MPNPTTELLEQVVHELRVIQHMIIHCKDMSPECLQHLGENPNEEETDEEA